MSSGNVRQQSIRRAEANLERLLNDFERVSDAQTHALLVDYANAKKVECEATTVYTNLRLLTTILTEMEMGKAVSLLKGILSKQEKEKLGFGRGKFTQFNDDVRAAPIADLSRASIRSYYANISRYGKDPKKKRSYQQVLGAFLMWRSSELIMDAEDLAVQGKENEAKQNILEAKRISGSLVSAIGKYDRKSYRDQSQKATWQPDHIELAIDVVRTRGEVTRRGSHHGMFPFAVRNQALWALGWELGLRPFELLELRLGDVTESDNSPNALQVSISSPRTGRVKNSKVHPRSIDVIGSVPYLRRWLKTHPFPDDNDAFLFCSFAKGNMAGQLNRDSLLKHVQGVAAAIKARLEERGEKFDVDAFDPYFVFRHSRITFVLRTKLMTIDDVEDYFGTGVNEIMRTYRRVTEKDVSRNYLSKFEEGLVTPPKPQVFARKFCPQCQEQIPKGSAICNLCGAILRAPVKEEKALMHADLPQERKDKIALLTRSLVAIDHEETRKMVVKQIDELLGLPLETFNPTKGREKPLPDYDLPEELTEVLTKTRKRVV